jgi:hypothetical protein
MDHRLSEQRYLGYGEDDPESTHNADVGPREDLAHGLALGGRAAGEEVAQALVNRRVVAGRGDDDPDRGDGERAHRREAVQLNVEQERPELRLDGQLTRYNMGGYVAYSSNGKETHDLESSTHPAHDRKYPFRCRECRSANDCRDKGT